MGFQQVRRSLRSEIERHLKERGYTLSKLGELTGINPGHISEILNCNPPRAITISQLDAMGAAFEQAPGWLYELYEEECFSEGKVSRPRVVPYLVRCAEIGRRDCIESVVSKLLENPKNVSILFSVAEYLFERGNLEKSIPFYQFVIETEKDSHAERFVLSQYRLFRALQSTDSEKIWEAVIRFDPYRKRLPENYQLDALLQLANVCYTLRKWEEVEKYADELRELAHIVYEDQVLKQKMKKRVEALNTERHLVVYYGQGYLLKGIALESQGKYEEAKRYVDAYADLSWFEIMDETGRVEVEKFRRWATANLYTLDMLTGNTDILPDYIRFLDDNPREILPGLVTIIKSANEFDFSIDSILEHFAESIAHFYEQQDAISTCQHMQFRYELAQYLFKNMKFTEGLDEILGCMVLSDTMMDYDIFKRCAALFWEHLSHASDQQKSTYHTIISKGRIKDERRFSIAGSSFGFV